MNMKAVVTNPNNSWTMCKKCQGLGKRHRKLSKKIKLNYQRAVEAYAQTGEGVAPVRPIGHLDGCAHCNGCGVLPAPHPPEVDTENHPHVAIIGAGIGGVALAVACLHRGIPFTLYERDIGFNTRKQGYGLTLQQAHKAMADLGVIELAQGVVSTKHVVHTPDGTQIAQWGMRHWEHVASKQTKRRRTNLHIPRQTLRMLLLKQLGEHATVKWGHQLLSYRTCEDDASRIDLSFQVDGQTLHHSANLVVGADGIRSTVRSLLVDETIAPLRYLGCIVILGICPLSALGFEHELLDAATVFQTANGHERIYMMPYTQDTVMWQLSFPMPEIDAQTLSAQGAQALKAEACRRLPWHDPIPQILAATALADITGYPVYDRDLLEPSALKDSGAITLLGDAAHPMSPFKGQGANQAILDALSLARCLSQPEWQKTGVRQSVLNAYEREMLERSALKVKASKEAAAFLHSDVVLLKEDKPRRLED